MRSKIMAAHMPVARALDILSLLSDHPVGMPVTRIAQQLAMPASAAHRLLADLLAKGAVAQEAETKRYRLTLMLPALGLRYLSSLNLTELCQPVLDDLARESQELVRLAVIDRRRLVWTAKSQGARSLLRVDPMTGREAVPHATAAGKAWLAALSNETAVEIVTRHGFGTPAERGPNLITKVDRLIAELESCRRHGYAITLDEGEPGIAAVGAIVRRGPGAAAPAVGTVSVAGPTVRLPRAALRELAPKVMAAAARLSAVWPAG